MEDFKNYAKNAGQNPKNTNGKSSSGGIYETVFRLAKKYDGKSQNELLRAIFEEAEKRKRAGTLTNAEIDNFVALLSPILDAKKRSYLNKIAADLKKI